MECLINKKPNLFVVDIQTKENSLVSKINQVVTTKIKPNSISASHLKSQFEYNEDDAEVWVFVGGDASSFL